MEPWSTFDSGTAHLTHPKLVRHVAEDEAMLDVANYKSDAGDAGLPPGTWVLLTQNMGAPDA